MDLQLKGKVALVTGSTTGIGFAIGSKEFFATVRPSSLLKRFASTDEVAALITFIASPLSAATNGAALRVDGGVIRSII